MTAKFVAQSMHSRRITNRHVHSGALLSKSLLPWVGGLSQLGLPGALPAASAARSAQLGRAGLLLGHPLAPIRTLASLMDRGAAACAAKGLAKSADRSRKQPLHPVGTLDKGPGQWICAACNSSNNTAPTMAAGLQQHREVLARCSLHRRATGS
mmetsp:Transcript_60673/g.168198  ORF Transcript_60673/g.168198 Transcript_60673/m.168198 type:complete len:154 (-) Transcript_60673:37-498(-)